MKHFGFPLMSFMGLSLLAFGTAVHADSGKVVAQYDDEDLPCVEIRGGVYKCSSPDNKITYVGGVKDGEFNGQNCRFDIRGKVSVRSNYVYGKPDGRCEIHYLPKNWVLVGTCDRNSRIVKGEINSPAGDHIKGEFAFGYDESGHVTGSLADGSRLDCGMRNFKLDGDCKIAYPNGISFSGKALSDDLEDDWKMSMPDGTVMEGDLENLFFYLDPVKVTLPDGRTGVGIKREAANSPIEVYVGDRKIREYRSDKQKVYVTDFER